jgi:hypothetical protein
MYQTHKKWKIKGRDIKTRYKFIRLINENGYIINGDSLSHAAKQIIEYLN